MRSTSRLQQLETSGGAASIAPFDEREVAVASLRCTTSTIIAIDPRGTIRFCAGALDTHFGYKSEELLGRNVKCLMPDPIADQHDGYVANYIRTGRATIIGNTREVRALHKDGWTFPIELAVRRTTIKGETAFIGVIRDISERAELDEERLRSTRVARAVNLVLDRFIGGSLWTQSEVFEEALASLLSLAESEFGLIGEINHSEDGSPYLQTQAISDVSWDSDTRRTLKESGRTGLLFKNLDSLLGATISTGDLVIANDPAQDERAGGVPPGHPVLTSYMGLPIYSGSQFIGMVGVANRKGGYSRDLVDMLRPYLNALGSVMTGFKHLKRRHRIAQDLFAAQRELRVMATRDALTDVLNRHAFMGEADSRFDNAVKHHAPLSLLFMDVDHFKAINDGYGHLVGDAILRGVADITGKMLREGDVLGRYGGEEFVIIASGCEVFKARLLAERIRAEIEQTDFEDGLLPVTVSIGVAGVIPGDRTVADVIARADEACYAAKGAGRNRVEGGMDLPAAAE